MIGQTVTVFNKSGKVVSTGKQLAAVFKEAKAAYLSRKAEIKAGRHAEYEEKRARHTPKKHTSHSDENLPRRAQSTRHVSRAHSTTSRRRHSHHREPEEVRKPLKRGHTEPLDAAYGQPEIRQNASIELPDRTLIRRNTSPPRRPRSSSSYDEHLAYGTLPDPAPALPLRHGEDEIAIRGEMSKLTQMLDEFNCLQYTATSMIEHLQKNPDALAAVALTLAEISGMVGRLAPGALTGMKAAFPAVMALLASPQFLIAAGLGVGVTVVMLGGYKIVKKMRAKKDLEGGDEMVQMQELEGDLSRIEAWRRGIAEEQAQSVAISVDGEYITPGASKRLIEEGVLDPANVHPSGERRKNRSERVHRRSSKAGSVRSEGTSRSKKSESGRKSKSRAGDDDKMSRSGSVKDGKRKRAVGGLKMLFQGKQPERQPAFA
jgi:hypothetical protein